MTVEFPMSNTDKTEKPEMRGEGQLFQALVAHWIHEDNLYWTQVRHLLVLQLPVFAAWFGLGRSLLGALVMFSSALISLYIYFMAGKIRRNRDVNLPAIPVISRSVVSHETEMELKRVLGDEYEKFGLFRFATHSLEETKDAGKKAQLQLFGLCITMNVLFGLLTVHELTCQDGWLHRLHPRFDRQVLHNVQPNPALPASANSAAPELRRRLALKLGGRPHDANAKHDKPLPARDRTSDSTR
jgi:hypothetical protein